MGQGGEAAQIAAGRTAADARSVLAQRTLARERHLYEQKVTARADYEQEQAEAAAAAAEARRAQVAAGAANVTRDGSGAIVASPISGRVTAESVSLGAFRSEEHTSELQSLMRNSYAVFCLKQKNLLHILIAATITHE